MKNAMNFFVIKFMIFSRNFNIIIYRKHIQKMGGIESDSVRSIKIYFVFVSFLLVVTLIKFEIVFFLMKKKTK